MVLIQNRVRTLLPELPPLYSEKFSPGSEDPIHNHFLHLLGPISLTRFQHWF